MRTGHQGPRSKRQDPIIPKITAPRDFRGVLFYTAGCRGRQPLHGAAPGTASFTVCQRMSCLPCAKGGGTRRDCQHRGVPRSYRHSFTRRAAGDVSPYTARRRGRHPLQFANVCLASLVQREVGERSEPGGIVSTAEYRGHAVIRLSVGTPRSLNALKRTSAPTRIRIRSRRPCP